MNPPVPALQQQLLNRSDSFRVLNLDLSSSDLANGQTLTVHGYGLTYLARGSHPGGLLQLNLGGLVKTFGPGDIITGEFTDFGLKRINGSSQSGNVALLVVTQPGIGFTEAPRLQIRNQQVLAGTLADPSDADSGIPNIFACQVPINTLPTALVAAGAYPIAAMLQVAGYRYIELTFSPLSAGPAQLPDVAFVATPWVHAGYGNGDGNVPYWAIQDDQVITIAANADAIFFDRTLEVRGRARLAFSFTGDESIATVGILARGIL